MFEGFVVFPGWQSLVRLGEKVWAEQGQIRCLESERIIHTDERDRGRGGVCMA